MIFKTKLAKIQLWSHENKGELKQYFENDLSDKIFINDVVFIEEKKTKFNKSRLLSEISGDTFLILPFFDNSGEKNIGIFTLGTKSFGDFYTIEEIGVLRGFSIFLERQIQYIKTYGLLKDLSLNLDKKVDEKTMEFNNLINRQKEFISMISHEVRAPIANAIFQADSIIDDMDKNALSRKEMKSEMDILNSQLIKAGELVTKLFSMQYFDTRSVELFKEQIQIADFLEAEYKVYARMHPEIRFIDLIDRTIKFVLIDRVQFQQVISNILQNAMKHLNTVEPKIAIEAFKKDGNLVIIIEDNGPGFIGINTSQLFDRYTTGKGEFVSLGMGLYLCKKIVEMHDGTIVAEESEKLS